MSELQEKIMSALKTVQDPDLHKDIVSLGFIKNLNIEGGSVKFDVELTTPACPVKEQLRTECETKVKAIDGVEQVDVNMTAVVRSTEHAQPVLPGVKNIVAVASGKGGVGKSTVSTNLAIALSLTGARVGLMDADIYGPSIPQMMGIPISSPKVGSENKFFPHEKHGLKVVSAAFLTKQGQPLMLRGPMLGGIIQQFLQNVEWGELDYLIIDLPPGTGDVQLTLTQKAPLSGAVVVTTPQEVSLIDADKGVKMFQQVKVPLLGIVENMSYFVCDGCDKKHHIFRQGGGKTLAENFKIPLLGEVPIIPAIAEAGDNGIPVVMSDPESPAGKAYKELAGQVAAQLSINQANSGEKVSADFELAWSTEKEAN
ncbi:MAG: Mrp/NBP35 family ATP-binding protein [Nitrospina sp.]|jgi:ATP-binding protein involved in chromosome partitioning|nr:Mrp/NBP35 family ATP-binding protein [Nitrospina sp.]MBT3413520.1 Mrp/NBP35 family ATP-binding protein [Nitrospina sp.]MBT3855347.1 Mrp/NBP35 family ATP-binding protein [Nitrospina sp.]MBT4104880.1 Mrp/NBP35 family ATP-binding protein [Nitrospina sp.]MBT4389371.1 Mrp/NBP35 family ATP-binding protein [Nitrospina sp.]